MGLDKREGLRKENMENQGKKRKIAHIFWSTYYLTHALHTLLFESSQHPPEINLIASVLIC